MNQLPGGVAVTATTYFPTHTSPPEAEGVVPIRAQKRSVRRLGHWTSAKNFDIRASRGAVVLDLRSTQIAPGDIEIQLDIAQPTSLKDIQRAYQEGRWTTIEDPGRLA
jgi:hypothetical protein